jgi:dihydrofolate reductase
MKTTVYVGTSLDGFIARSDGDIEWLVTFEDDEVRQAYEGFMRTIDAVVIGRGTFDKALTFPSWPYEKKVFVLSTQLKKVPEGLQGKVTLLSMKPREVLNHLAGEGLENIYVDGGKVIQEFLKVDCIDELIITKVPLLIGSGLPLFGELEMDLRFAHVRTDVYGHGLVKSCYARRRF